MAITKPHALQDESFMQSLRDNMSRSLEKFLKDEYEAKKKELMEQMDKRFYEEIAGIALTLTNLCDFQMMQDRLVITVHRKDTKNHETVD